MPTGTKIRYMRNQKINIKRSRSLHDYPELQVGFPERNDVTNPDGEVERAHVDIERLEASKGSEREIVREIRSRATRDA